MLEAPFWGFTASASLILGAWLGTVVRLSTRLVGLVMGFGAGALIGAVSFELVVDAIDDGGTLVLTLGLAGGAVSYYTASRILAKATVARGGTGVAEASGLAITVGAALDGIPESIILGVSLIGGGSVSAAFLAAVLLSNLPEGIGAAADLGRAGEPPRRIVLRFVVIAIASAAAAASGFLVFDGFDPRALATVQSFAAGALLTMVMDTMAPEAFAEAGPLSGLVAVAGFELTFLLSNASP